jgi:hypothetical protein
MSPKKKASAGEPFLAAAGCVKTERKHAENAFVYRKLVVGDNILCRMKYKKGSEETKWLPAEVAGISEEKPDVCSLTVFFKKETAYPAFKVVEESYGTKFPKTWYIPTKEYFEKIKTEMLDRCPAPNEEHEEHEDESESEDSQKVVAAFAGGKATNKKSETPAPKKKAKMEESSSDAGGSSSCSEKKLEAKLRAMEEMFMEKFNSMQQNGSGGFKDGDNEYKMLREMNHTTLPEYKGVMMPYKMKQFDELDIKQKRLYLGGVMDVSGIGNPLNSGKTMCSYYKNIVTECQSKEKKEFTVKKADGEEKKVSKFISGLAEYFHMSLLGLPYIREGYSSSELAKYLRKHSLCNKCRSCLAPTAPMVNLVKKSQCCSMCRRGFQISSAPCEADSLFKLCTRCHAASNNTGNGFSEDLMLHSLEPLQFVFDKLLKEFSITSNRAMTLDGNRTRSPDVIVEFVYMGVRCIIIIENDPDSHRKYAAEDEDKKLKDQSVTLMRRFMKKNKIMDAGAFRMLFIRYNNNGKYTTPAGVAAPGVQYTMLERLVILRRWIVWWITHIEEVRNYSMFYMFYDHSMHKLLTYEKRECFAKVYHAPQPDADSKKDWAYCLDFMEIAAPRSRKTGASESYGMSAYDQINANQVLTAQQFGVTGYVMEKSKQDAVAPVDLIERMKGGVVTVAASTQGDDEDAYELIKSAAKKGKKKSGGTDDEEEDDE